MIARRRHRIRTDGCRTARSIAKSAIIASLSVTPTGDIVDAATWQRSATDWLPRAERPRIRVVADAAVPRRWRVCAVDRPRRAAVSAASPATSSTCDSRPDVSMSPMPARTVQRGRRSADAESRASGAALRTAVIDDRGRYTYALLNERSNRFANVLRGRRLTHGERVLLCLEDSVDFPVCFLGAIRAGAVPVPLNTLMTTKDYAYIVADSEARLVVVSSTLLRCVGNRCSIAATPRRNRQRRRIRCIGSSYRRWRIRCASHPTAQTSAATRRTDVAFWLYTSGTTGKPKGRDAPPRRLSNSPHARMRANTRVQPTTSCSRPRNCSSRTASATH